MLGVSKQCNSSESEKEKLHIYLQIIIKLSAGKLKHYYTLAVFENKSNQ